MADTTVTISGRVVDLAKALPITVGDWRKLKRVGVTPGILRRMENDPDFDVIAAWVHFVLHKADPGITEDHVNALAPRQMNAIGKLLNALQRDDEDPLSASPSSTDSPPSTAGASGT